MPPSYKDKFEYDENWKSVHDYGFGWVHLLVLFGPVEDEHQQVYRLFNQREQGNYDQKLNSAISYLICSFDVDFAE